MASTSPPSVSGDGVADPRTLREERGHSCLLLHAVRAGPERPRYSAVSANNRLEVNPERTTSEQTNASANDTAKLGSDAVKLT